MFMGLIKNEFIKLYSKKKTYIILFLFIALSGVFVAVNQVSENNYLKYNSPKYRVSNMEENIKYQKEYLNNIAKDEALSEEDKAKEIAAAEEALSYMEDELARLKESMINEEEIDWKKSAQAQLDSLRKDYETANEENKAYMKNDIEKIQTHIKHNIPLDEESLNKGFNYLLLNIMVVASGFLAFGLILFNADSVSTEYNPGTLKFLLIQPVTRIKVLLSKFIVMLTSSLILIIITQLVFCLGVGLIKGFGSLNRPILVGHQYEFVVEFGNKILKEIPNTTHYIPLSEFLLKALLLESIFIIVMVSFIFMISTISKSSVIAMTVTIGALLGSNIVYMLSTTYRRLSSYIFLHFTNIESIITGTIVRETRSLQFTYNNVIIVSIITSIVFLIISLVIFKKRDIQI
ncbi:ABC transporter permease [Anaerocolumna aminovalerica]|jgi:ABC-2 type transport system permease protein|uniref:ABC-2 type transport system permease protein n=1 Tax=Anaerocolumna aminovalerica TaxID=1527 RepID=A0A1I5FFJ9_9FIRM|nr:ABC transporter permease subunit [Anaerocolumna aminovalerica]SFO22081.1 ABC-2 type transport system permease protein [Anaerocolumna aminovalerica]